MNIVIGVCFVLVIVVVAFRLVAGLETPRAKHSRDMQTAYTDLRSGRMVDRSRSEFRADARKYR